MDNSYGPKILNCPYCSEAVAVTVTEIGGRRGYFGLLQHYLEKHPDAPQGIFTTQPVAANTSITFYEIPNDSHLERRA